MRHLIQYIRAVPILLTLIPIAAAKANLPQPQGLVNDFAHKLSPDTKQNLETTLRDFRARSDIEIAVIIISFDDLQGYAIEDYALQMARRWGVGRGFEKLGLLLVIAIKPPDRKGIYQGLTRLEVSRRLEGDITNSLAGELIHNMRDDLKAGRFDQAVTTGTNSIISALTSKRNISNVTTASTSQPTPPQQPLRNESSSSDWSGILIQVIFVGVLAVIIVRVMNRGIGNRGAGGRRSGYYNYGDHHSYLPLNNYNDRPTTDSNNNSFDSPGLLDGSSGGSDFSDASDFGSSSSGDSDSGGGDFGGDGATDSW